ncbi:MlaC/ttg2D family ABC transporter substrate-binding protein [Pyruvatibacter sp. HU-CL02332]|uniref:MlaC/ttg2D family ABC transporter substrate-binding protein n=1 Tax=Pyruvatibacter sp. HU-CL02332 TaxID=3127650 RepID=UPI0031077827
MYVTQKLSLPSFSISAAIAAAFALALLSFSAPAKADEAAEAFVAELGGKAIEILSNEELTPEETEANFRTLLLDAMDIRRVGLFALGQYARLPTKEERTTYFDLLGEFIVKVYLGRLTGYSDQEFVVTSSKEKGKKGREVIVDSRIDFGEGREPLTVDWWLLRNKDGSFKVFDVNVAGIWMAQEQRGAFSSHIRNNGGKFEALLAHLRAQTQSATTNAAADTSIDEDAGEEAEADAPAEETAS